MGAGDGHGACELGEGADDGVVVGFLGDEEADAVLGGCEDHDAVDELVGVVPREDDGAVFWDVIDADNVNLTEENGEDGPEKHPDAVVKEFLGVGEEEVPEHDEAGVGEPSRGDAEGGSDDLDRAVLVGEGEEWREGV